MEVCDESDPVGNETRARLAALVAEANTSEHLALLQLRRYLHENPVLWRKLGDVTAHAEFAWRERISRGDALLAESVNLEADRLRRALLGARPGPVERMLVDQIVVTHLELAHRQIRAADAPAVKSRQAALEQKGLEGAQRRFLEAVKMLETVRRLIGQAESTPSRALKATAAG